MSVSISVILPNQPPGAPEAGSVEIHPLGGNGFVSPHSVYHGTVSLIGDASGGEAKLNLGFDPRYSQMVNHLAVQIAGMTADMAGDMQIRETGVSRMGPRFTIKHQPVPSLAAEGRVSWSPVPYIVAKDNVDPDLPANINATFENIDLAKYTLFFHIFNFDRRAREVVPLELIASVLTRSESVFT